MKKAGVNTKKLDDFLEYSVLQYICKNDLY